MRDPSHFRANSRREREAWRLAILFHEFVWTQRSSLAGEGIGTSGMERLRRFLHPAGERKGILDTQRMHANAGSRHGNGTYSLPTTLNSQPNHTRRMSHTIRTITIIVPTIPIPNIAPPRGHIAHQGCPCRHDRSGFRLLSEQNQTDHRNGICARSVEYVVVLIRICRCTRVPPRPFGFPRKDSEGKY